MPPTKPQPYFRNKHKAKTVPEYSWSCPCCPDIDIVRGSKVLLQIAAEVHIHQHEVAAALRAIQKSREDCGQYCSLGCSQKWGAAKTEIEYSDFDRLLLSGMRIAQD